MGSPTTSTWTRPASKQNATNAPGSATDWEWLRFGVVELAPYRDQDFALTEANP